MNDTCIYYFQAHFDYFGQEGVQHGMGIKTREPTVLIHCTCKHIYCFKNDIGGEQKEIQTLFIKSIL